MTYKTELSSVKKLMQNQPGLVGLVSIILALFNPVFTSCMCGHMSWISLPGNAIAFALCWCALVMRKTKSIIASIILLLACVLTSYALFCNGADILWLGHNPLLK